MSSNDSSFGDLNQVILPKPPSRKWVTFDDLMDDALESGKLNKTDNSQVKERSILSHGEVKERSVLNGSDGSLNQGQVEVMKGSLIEGEVRRGSFNVGNNQGQVEVMQRSVLSGSSEGQVRRGSFNMDQGQSEVRKHDKLDFSQSLGHEAPSKVKVMVKSESETSMQDKYSIFAELKNKTYKGWSGKVLTKNHQFGWSDEVLEYEAVSSEDDASSGASPYTSPKDESWMKNIKQSSWERSPSRTFVRNFP